MPVPLAPLDHPRCQLRWPLLLLLSLFGLILPARLSAAPRPTNRIALQDLGFLPLSPRYLLDGSSMIALHYVDDTHLLITFDARRLIPRIPNDPPTDQDHNVDFLLLELPTGRLLARTELLVHDHGQYLWNLGHGEFLLRQRDSFTTFAPLRNLASGKPFGQYPFLRTDRHVVAVLLSPQADFLTLESTDPIPLVDPDPDPFTGVLGRSNERPAPRVQLNFYRLGQPDPSGQIVPRNAGRALSRRPIELPLSSEGLLNVLDQGRQRWAFDFKSHSGKRSELALFDSTCRPIPYFISPSEFLVFGCHGGGNRQTIAAFNLRGDATWQQALPGSYVAPSFVFAPSVGRFALGRLIINAAVAGIDTLDPSMVLAQSVDVIQNDSGKTLFHIDCTPAARAGQNFAFSPDGMNFAVIREGAIEIYALPPLGPQDKNAIQLAVKSAPPATEADVDLSEISTRIPGVSGQQNSQDTTNAGETAPIAPPTVPATPDQPSTPQSATTQSPTSQPPADSTPAPSADQSPTSSSTQASNPTEAPAQPEPPVRRKPPTLYNPPAPDPSAPPQ